MDRRPSGQVTTLTSLVNIGNVTVEMFLVCHVILQNKEIKWSCDFMGRSPSRQVTNL